jgi:toxin ParE1/3/4
VAREVVYEQSARDDLRSIFDWIADADVASAYLDRIYDHCAGLVMFAERGTPHDDIIPGLRTIGFERKAAIAYLVEPDTVRILRVLHKGRDIGRNFQR